MMKERPFCPVFRSFSDRPIDRVVRPFSEDDLSSAEPLVFIPTLPMQRPERLMQETSIGSAFFQCPSAINTRKSAKESVDPSRLLTAIRAARVPHRSFDAVRVMPMTMMTIVRMLMMMMSAKVAL